jgi:N-dimethylarginine dimethylaminohydrolase
MASSHINTEKPVILMCPPDHFEPALPHPIHGYANAFEQAGRKSFERDPAGFRERAHEQWAKLKEVFSRHARLVMLQPVPGRPDQVYTADASFSLRVYDEAITVLSDFTNAKRAPEVETHRAMLESLNDNRMIVQCPYKIEGNGDNVLDPFRGIIWSGYTHQATFANAAHGRSSLEAHDFLSERTNVKVVSLRTRKPFFHIDTVLGPLANGHILAHYESLHPDSHETFIRHAFKNPGLDQREHLILISNEDAHRLAANIRCFGNHVVMPECSRKLQDTIKSKGYEVETVNIDAFLAGGGGVHCLSNAVNEISRAPG